MCSSVWVHPARPPQPLCSDVRRAEAPRRRTTGGAESTPPAPHRLWRRNRHLTCPDAPRPQFPPLLLLPLTSRQIRTLDNHCAPPHLGTTPHIQGAPPARGCRVAGCTVQNSHSVIRCG